MGKVFTQTTTKEKKIGTELNSVQKDGLLSGVSPDPRMHITIMYLKVDEYLQFNLPIGIQTCIY